MIIAKRTLQLKLQTSNIDVQISILLPEKESGGWTCRYSIEWPDELAESYAGGADAVQALLCAMQKIALELYASDAHHNGQLSWSDDWSGFGFPVPATARDMLIGSDAEFL